VWKAYNTEILMIRETPIRNLSNKMDTGGKKREIRETKTEIVNNKTWNSEERGGNETEEQTERKLQKERKNKRTNE
jgi:hypothetical protein